MPNGDDFIKEGKTWVWDPKTEGWIERRLPRKETWGDWERAREDYRRRVYAQRIKPQAPKPSYPLRQGRYPSQAAFGWSKWKGLQPGVKYTVGSLLLINMYDPQLATLPVDYVRDLRQQIASRLEELGMKVVMRARELTPKRTNTLANAFQYRVQQQDLMVWNDVSYFPYIEARTHMLRDAWNEYAAEIEEAIINDAKNLSRLR